MKPTEKEYTTRAEKQKDFFLGIGAFIGLNVIFYILVPLPMILANSAISNRGDYGSSLCVSMGFLLQVLANIGTMTYFAFTRKWIALGMLGTIAFLLLIAMIAGVVWTAICFSQLRSQL